MRWATGRSWPCSTSTIIAWLAAWSWHFCWPDRWAAPPGRSARPARRRNRHGPRADAKVCSAPKPGSPCRWSCSWAERSLGGLARGNWNIASWHCSPTSTARWRSGTAGYIRVDPWSGHLELDGLQIPDPANLERDRLRIAHVRARLLGGPLLRDRLEIEHLRLAGIERDVARRKAATAVTTRIPQIRFSPAPLALPANPSQELELHDYVRGWDQFASRISMLGQLLNTLERVGSLEPDRPDPASSATLFGPAARAARSNLGTHPRPRADDRADRGRRLRRELGDGPQAARRAFAAIHESKTGQKSSFAQDRAAGVVGRSAQHAHDFTEPGRCHRPFRSKPQVVDLPLESLVEQSSGGSRVAVEDGRISISGEGWMDDSRFDLALQIQITALQARMQGADPAAGITPAAWNRGLEKLGGLRVELTCGGQWTSPRLHVQGRDLVNQFKHQLRSAGDHNLLASIEEQLAAPAAPVVAAVVVTDAIGAPVELPHPLPNPDPLTANQAAAPIYQGVERLPLPAPAAVRELERRVAVQSAPPAPKASFVQASPAPTAVVSDTSPSPPTSLPVAVQTTTKLRNWHTSKRPSLGQRSEPSATTKPKL